MTLVPQPRGDVARTHASVGLDEAFFARQGPWRTHAWSTTIADVHGGQLIDVIPGQSAAEACRWFDAQPSGWCEQIAWAVLDLSGPWRLTFDTMLPWATQVADPFHVTKLANQRLDEVRRRVQNETLRRRGRKHDPLYRSPGYSLVPMNALTTVAARSWWVPPPSRMVPVASRAGSIARWPALRRCAGNRHPRRGDVHIDTTPLPRIAVCRRHSER